MKVTILNKKVAKELDELGFEALATLARISELMIKYGTFALGLPHVRKIQDPLWEIRIKDKKGISRVIFVSVKNKEIILLHAFRKKTQKTPKQAIDLAIKRSKEI